MSSDSFKDYVIDQLRGMESLTCRPMFGGLGLYDGNTFFGIIFKGRIYLKTDSITARSYREKGMLPFQPNRKQKLKNYYEVPAEVLEDREEFLTWANRAAGNSPD